MGWLRRSSGLLSCETHRHARCFGLYCPLRGGMFFRKKVSMNWIAENGGTLAVLAVVVVIVLLSLRLVFKDKKAGKSVCGSCSGCSGCSMKGRCGKTEGSCPEAGGTRAAADSRPAVNGMIRNTVKIDGMMCGMCEAHICDTIRSAIPSAKNVKASHRAGEAVFETAMPVDEAKLKAAIDATGYRFISLK